MTDIISWKKDEHLLKNDFNCFCKEVSKQAKELWTKQGVTRNVHREKIVDPSPRHRLKTFKRDDARHEVRNQKPVIQNDHETGILERKRK